MQRLAIRLNSRDNVATALRDLRVGAEVQIDDKVVALRSDVPFGHKLAVRRIAPREPIVKYGELMGLASTSINEGEHVHVHNVESYWARTDVCCTNQRQMKFVEGKDDFLSGIAGLETAREVLDLEEPLAFMGYRRPDGAAGVRNHILILPTVGCVNSVATQIGQRMKEVVPITHPYGCTQLGADLEQTKRVLMGFATHANVGAVALVSLGCETMPLQEMGDEIRRSGKALLHLVVQEEGGRSHTVERALQWLEEVLEEQRARPREPVPLHELIVGTECGGSDALSGLTANPALGVASDFVVARGGTVILSETPELIGAEHLLLRRAADQNVATGLVQIIGSREEDARAMGMDLRGAQPTPGNIAGGITTIEEKSLGAIRKAGTTAVREVLGYAIRPTKKGLVIMDTPGYDPSSITAMVAGGAHVIVFTTGRGTPIGSPIAPVIKVASNSDMFRRMEEHMDIDCGAITEQGESTASLGARIFQEILNVANGNLTKAEILEQREFAISRLSSDL